MSKAESQDGTGAEPGDVESYQPPQIIVLGSITELTSGVGGAGKDFDTSSGPC
jgi:hypothetical protein